MGDTVEVQIKWETGTSHTSIVYWNMLDGAFIDSHPVHIQMHGSVTHRNLSNYLQNNLEVYCKKVKSFNK